MVELKGLLCLLEERLTRHDNNRKEVQEQLQERCNKIIEETNSFEEKITKELQESFNLVEERILGHIEKFNNNNEGQNDNSDLIKQAQKVLSTRVKYEIEHSTKAKSFIESYRIKAGEEKNNMEMENENDIESIISRLQEHLDEIHESVISVQGELFDN